MRKERRHAVREPSEMSRRGRELRRDAAREVANMNASEVRVNDLVAVAKHRQVEAMARRLPIASIAMSVE